jgi:tRNA (guanine37-N1)-methyltransferase
MGLLEYPQYTRPADYRGMKVPKVLTGGNHADIVAWRREKALEITRERRPDMLAQHPEYEEMLKPKVKKRKTRSKVSEQ